MYKCAKDTKEELEVELVEDLKSREPSERGGRIGS